MGDFRRVGSKNMKISSVGYVFFVAFVAFVTMSGSANAQAKKSGIIKVTKTEKMLRDSKAKYTPFQGDDSFMVIYAAKEEKEIAVVIIETVDAILVFADVAAGREVELTSDVMRKLLEYNMEVDFIKAGISDIGSIRVQTEQGLLSMSAKTFKMILDQTAAGADEVAKIIAPVRKASPAAK